MDYARYLLENTQKTVYQIAEYVSYKNATHFTAAFKKKFLKPQSNSGNKANGN